MQEKNDEMPQTKLDPFFELMVFNPASRLSSLNPAIPLRYPASLRMIIPVPTCSFPRNVPNLGFSGFFFSSLISLFSQLPRPKSVKRLCERDWVKIILHPSGQNRQIPLPSQDSVYFSSHE